MASGFINGFAGQNNGGLALGFQMGARRGLASGMQKYVGANDDVARKQALSEIAGYDPNTALKIQELERQDRITPYQQAQLDLNRQQLERQGELSEYQKAQIDMANRKLNEEKEEKKLLGDALYRYQTAGTDEDKNAALADVYRISPAFAKDILKKQKESEEKGYGNTELGLSLDVMHHPEKYPANVVAAVKDYWRVKTKDPLVRGMNEYEANVGKQYAQAGMPYGSGYGNQNFAANGFDGIQQQIGQMIQNPLGAIRMDDGIDDEIGNNSFGLGQIPSAASLAADKKRAEEAIDLEFSPQKKTAEAEAKKYAEDLDAVRTAEANYPQLEANVNRLRELAPIATFTKAGKTRDFVAKEFFGSTTDGAKARAELESIVNNAVLPLLKQTFGAAFTAEEGLRLQKTLANPDATDKEKIAELDTFIKQKKADIETKRRKIKLYGENGGNYLLEDNVSEQQKEPTREELEAELRRRGVL